MLFKADLINSAKRVKNSAYSSKEDVRLTNPSYPTLVLTKIWNSPKTHVPFCMMRGTSSSRYKFL